MFSNMSTLEILKLLLPLIVIQLGLMIFCLLVLRKEKVKYLPKVAWAIIIIFGELLGPIIFLLIGRERN